VSQTVTPIPDRRDSGTPQALRERYSERRPQAEMTGYNIVMEPGLSKAEMAQLASRCDA